MQGLDAKVKILLVEVGSFSTSKDLQSWSVMGPHMALPDHKLGCRPAACSLRAF